MVKMLHNSSLLIDGIEDNSKLRRGIPRIVSSQSMHLRNFVPLLDTLALFFQIRDDYANLLSEEYKENKSFCEDLTEGKFSFPIIHAIRSDSESTRILNILRQRTTDVDVKKCFVDCLEQIGSFAYTKVILKQMEDKRCCHEKSLYLTEPGSIFTCNLYRVIMKIMKL
ncbi:unnamed protein product [Pocillopora meandrina]|uniref:Uncharacterized protein n=1 Tax=Pocillopora meandrina TaxID=46732 RepID=A0AAU9XT35_9CNID|nr:unnamed protein product [Pocillopora meandrina]